MKASRITREFGYNGMKLPDPNPALSVEQAVRSLAAAYPELATAKIEPTELVDGPHGKVQLYRLKVAVGVKG